MTERIDREHLARLDVQGKKRLLAQLVSSLVDDLSAEEARELLGRMLCREAEPPRVIHMVEH